MGREDRVDQSGDQIAAEQAYTDTLYARLDELVVQATKNLDSVQVSQFASTHQNRSERDAFMALYEDRLAALRAASQNVVFGRLDMDGGDQHYIGRIGLFTADRDQLLVDWRAPAAAAFYQATSVDRMDVRLRRHLITRGRTVVALEDDVLDTSLIDADGEGDGQSLQGEGALLAAVTSQRTGRMGDIVATIQAEQDRIIRSDNRGVLVVQGGPGTGKTAVALHRAAYLLYTHRRRLEHSGVLIVAPSRGFLRYIERVLPSLGESGVVMLTPGELVPGVSATEHDSDPIARFKGGLEMSTLLARAVKQRQIIPERDVDLRIDGTDVRLTRDMVGRARREARATHRPHNDARTVFVRAALDMLVIAYEDALRRDGATVVPEDRPGYLNDLRNDDSVRRALNFAWLPYTPESFLRILFAHPERIRKAAPPDIRDRAVDLLTRPKDAPWTIDDVPLLDEVAELLGGGDEKRRRSDESDRKADVSYARDVLENVDPDGLVRAEDLADQVRHVRDSRTLAERASSERDWTYGHVVVDEAQELSPMMWRALMRRNPSKSFTVVGDVAQTSSAAGTRSWTEALAPFVEDRLEIAPLTVNYRTPSRIMDVAIATATALDVPITTVSSVREGEHPVTITAADAERRSLRDAVAARVRDQKADAARIAVIAEAEQIGPLAARLREETGIGRVGTGSVGVDDDIAVMTAEDSKGLEFDGVVLVEPAAILGAGARGDGDLYVAMTRTTQRLDIVHEQPLPGAVADAIEKTRDVVA